MYQDPNRQTGRTERMLQEAEHLLAEGKNVIVYCLPQQAGVFRERLGDTVTIHCHYFREWPPAEQYGYVELFDHAFISQHYGAWIREFHRFDEAQS